MKKYIIPLLLFLLVFSCKKEKFPDKDILIGTWIEQDGNNSKIIFTEQQMFLFLENFVDTNNYTLNKEDNVLILSSTNDPDIKTELRILYNKKSEELKIWDLFVGIPEEENISIYKKM